MALRINTNIAALNAHSNLKKTDGLLSKSLERLSTGLRINRSADDAAGLSIANVLKSQSIGIGQAIKNANDGISIVQIGDAALDETVNILNSIKAKTIQAAQDGQTTESRKAIQADIDKLIAELDDIANNTAFSGQKLLSGGFVNKKFQVGAYSGQTVDINIGSTQSTKIGHVTTAVLSPNTKTGGVTQLSIYSSVKNEWVDLQSVELAFDNSFEHSMGALADAINLVSDDIGVTAQADVSVTSVNAVQAGTTGSDFAINGVVIGAVTVLDNDSDGALVNAINAKSGQHGVTASVDEGGYLTLTSSDGRAIKVSGETGTVLTGSDMTTFGQIKLYQAGANEIKISDEADMVSLNLTSDLTTSGDTTNIMDSTLAENSILQSGSILEAGSSLGFTLTQSNLNGDVTTTQDSYITAGSVLSADTETVTSGATTADYFVAADVTLDSTASIATGSVLEAGTIINSGATLNGTGYAGGTTLTSDVTITGNTTLSTGSQIKTGTFLKTGTNLRADFTGTTGSAVIEANSVLGGSAQNANDLTLNSDSLLKAGSVLADDTVLAAGTTVTTRIATTVGYIEAGTTISSDVTLSGSATLLADMVAKQNSVIEQVSTLNAGSYVDADITLTSDMTVTNGMTLKNGSVIADGTNLSIKDGSTIGGRVTTSADVTVSRDMTLKTGSVIQSNSTIAKGSSIGGYTTTNGDVTLASDMTLAAGTELASSTLLKAGTVLTDDIWAAGGVLYEAGTVLSGDVYTSGTNRLDADMTLKANSVIKSGSILAPAETSGSGASVTTSLSDVEKYRLSDINVLTQDSAQVAISIVDSALSAINKVKSDLGSTQNQLTSTIANLATTQVNVTAAESQIRDVDFAEESSNFSKMQILMQAGTFAMAQANASAQNVLRLLQ